MTTSRQKILAHLKKTRSASAREIARALKLSAPNARHHLSVLCSDGRVETSVARNRQGRGRPEKLYSLSQAALGDNFPALVQALLAQTGSKVSMEATAHHLLDEKQFANYSINKRLTLLVEKLNEMHYQARWEAGAGGPRVTFGRCPYAKAAAARPELCKMDEALLKNAVARKVTPIRRGESIQGSCPFVFEIA
ncbi:MAG: winged helix-turn-helix transcriptional regulator [Chloroflexi bacterium CFX1]|nr:winged helix-turn-helix transcriptional regulator [Chloroflexi bacterium CFX1]MCQ3952784.1 hypothetical protein [Chloroflexota bacterium]MDL1918040.1 winged helix-turn-helix transcriptional regulator [Chloroflexi bacterium CFX5]NUQ58587.1 winged helix-turn-helix transcriptional regulator [Anaerolineales bacterium]